MRRLFTVLLLIAALIAGVGFYRGWLVLQDSNTQTLDGKMPVGVEVDTDKVEADIESIKPDTTTP